MKIIKKGQIPEEKTYQHECDYCRTLFEVLKKEMKYKTSCRNESWLEINCPLCDKTCRTEH